MESDNDLIVLKEGPGHGKEIRAEITGSRPPLIFRYPNEDAIYRYIRKYTTKRKNSIVYIYFFTGETEEYYGKR